jgi:RNA polymerase sigma-70 factor (ECF subfamily)
VLHFACRVAVFTSLAARRRLEVRMRWADDRAPESTGGSDSHLPSSEYLAARRRSALRELLRDLPEAQAETLVLSAVLGYSPQEIARITGAPANTVRSRLRLAKIALRDRIKTDPELTETLQEAP